MSSLSRYKKSGGFYQLLSLIETFGPAKKEKFLEMIEGESPAWGAALRDKMITLERLFTWPDQIVVEVVKRLPIKSQAYALSGLKEDQRAKVVQFYSASELRRMDDVMVESAPRAEDVQSTLFKLVEVARRMIQDREVSPDKFDAGLTIPDDFEAKIEMFYRGGLRKTMPVDLEATQPMIAVATEHDAPVVAPAALADVEKLRLALASVLKENRALRDELKAMKTRLDQIKKIA